MTETNNEAPSPRISRREFLKWLGTTMATLTAGEIFNILIGERIEAQEPNLPPLGKDTLSQYVVAWNAKPWVWINLTLAAQKINGLKIPPGEELSLIEALQLNQMSHVPRTNTDPRQGYIAAQMSEEIGGWGYGLCLASTATFRAALKSPLEIKTAGTHYDIYPDYFEDPEWPLGTDAAIFNPDPGDTAPKVDLVLKNPTNQEITLVFQVYDSGGRLLSPPDHQLSLAFYKANYIYHLVAVLRRKIDQLTGWELPRHYLPEYTLYNRRIIVRAGFTASSPEKINYQTYLTPPQPTGDSHGNVSFKRILILNGRRFTEVFTSQYGLSQSGENF